MFDFSKQSEQSLKSLEQALIDHVVLSYLRLQKAELAYSRAAYGPESLVTPPSEHIERQLSLVHARVLRACETLARVRRLAQPAMGHVNIAERQATKTASP